ncbi:hypothetical protein BBJ28_00003186 [Nothophytophthora sp. Chile5]|nr:hypothetical protein BBJ28_00003186 [Nothophytophthora sp. Chile5]
MLRGRPQSVRLQAQRQQQRLLWGRASDLMSWMGFGGSSPSNDQPSTVQRVETAPLPPSAAATEAEAAGAFSRKASKRVLRPQPPEDATFPVPEDAVGTSKRRAAGNALAAFSRHVKRASTSAQLLSAWQIASQCQPFLMDRKDNSSLRLATTNDYSGDRLRLLQMAPAAVFAQLATGISSASMFVGASVAASATELEPSPEPVLDVVVVNEAVIVANLVLAFHNLGNHDQAVAFFEAYDRDRSTWLQEQQLRDAAASSVVPSSSVDGLEDGSEPTGTLKAIERITLLPRSVYATYLRSLARTKQTKKLLRVFEDDERQLERLCSTVPNVHLVLHACLDEKDGALAGRAIDAIVQYSPAAVVPLACYELAIRANLRARQRGERELQTALRLARLLHKDGGYVLKPHLWSALIKVSLNMGRADCALEVFKSYPHHRILEYQTQFRHALRAACHLKESDTALAMMRFCWAGHQEEYLGNKTLFGERHEYEEATFVNRDVNMESLASDAEMLRNDTTLLMLKQDAETELLNMMLWELLKHRHPAPALKQVLDLMNDTRSKGGAVVLRLAVTALLEHDVKQMKLTPRKAVENSLKFWDDHSFVLRAQGFLVHLLLAECMARQWDDECELLVDYMLELGVIHVPIHSVVKLMGTNELRGRFAANARISEKLLTKLPHEARRKLREVFYERYLMSCLRLEQFEKVREQYARLNLEQRYPHNEVLRTILRDAASQ